MPKYDCTGIISAVSNCLLAWKEYQVSQTSNALSNFAETAWSYQGKGANWTDMIIFSNADVIKSTWLFILRLKFLFSEILLDDVWKKKSSRGKQLDRKQGAKILPLYICQVHWGRMLTGLQSQQCVQDSVLEERREWKCQRTLKGQRDAAFPPKALLACQISSVHNRRGELVKEGGQESSGGGSSSGKQRKAELVPGHYWVFRNKGPWNHKHMVGVKTWHCKNRRDLMWKV